MSEHTASFDALIGHWNGACYETSERTRDELEAEVIKNQKG